jgi:hypothetical protein
MSFTAKPHAADQASVGRKVAVNWNVAGVAIRILGLKMIYPGPGIICSKMTGRSTFLMSSGER